MRPKISRRDSLKYGIGLGVAACTSTVLAEKKMAQPGGTIVVETTFAKDTEAKGVHTHVLDDEEAGSFDEFYYVISGEGQMEIAGEIVAVAQGDHVFTPIGVPHGIENTSSNVNLKVFLTSILR